jgi:hypothetical protein
LCAKIGTAIIEPMVRNAKKSEPFIRKG